MPPVRSYNHWNTRSSEEQIEPYRKYYFICEGANTETWYFKKLIDFRKILNINPVIDVILLEKTEEDRDISYPRKLIEFAKKQIDYKEISFDKERDKLIVVFDADIFENKVMGYENLLMMQNEYIFFAVSNPSFELFLLLHYENSYDDLILPNEDEIVRNEKVGNQRFISNLLLTKTGINAKTNKNIGNLALNVDIAIEQEKKINEDINSCKGMLTCNIGKIIEGIRADFG